MANPIALEIDLNPQQGEARQFAKDNPDRTLGDLLRLYPARFRADGQPTAAQCALPLAHFILKPVRLPNGVAFPPPTAPATPAAPPPALRARLDQLWAAEQAQPTSPVAPGPEPTAYPMDISDNQAVRIAYRTELDEIADYLRYGLSVLVVCDKLLTEYIYEFVCHRAGKQPVLESTRPDDERRGLATRLDQAVQGETTNPLTHLPQLLHNLKPREVLVLRALDLLDTPPLIELIYQRAGSGDKPQILAFLDPSLEVRKVLTDRFAVHVSLIGLPRSTQLPDGRKDYTVTHLLTRGERACFAAYDPEGLYKNVAGLNAVQFRNAMRFVGASVQPNTAAREIYQRIRSFKISSSEDIEIPDISFDDIGGYEEVKHQLKRIIALVAGPIAGLDERQRGQLIPRGFIFHGPPGTGKTLFAKAIANEMDATIQMVSGPEIMDKYVGQSENNLRRIFATARRNAPAVVFFDEFDSLASQRSNYADGGARANNAVVAQLLTELDGFRQGQAVLVIGTTNRIDIIDEALIRPSRLRPIEIGRPDYVARQQVATLHAKNFGVATLLQDLCTLALAHLAAWEASAAAPAERTIPPAFLEALFTEHEPHRLRYTTEAQRAGLLRELGLFFSFVRDAQAAATTPDAGLLHQVRTRVQELAAHYGLKVEEDTFPDLAADATRAWLLPMQSDLRDLFLLLAEERRTHGGLTPTAFLAAVMDLMAEYTDTFNNDEIRAIFQEASLEHHMEGQLITPRYLGQKIGLIRKRRDERESIHLSAGLRRR